MLTYTLENALQRIDQEVDAMAISLEEVHLGSETLDQERVSSNGAAYLEAAAPTNQPINNAGEPVAPTGVTFNR